MMRANRSNLDQPLTATAASSGLRHPATTDRGQVPAVSLSWVLCSA